MKKISIIVPVYNTEKYLERCLESIINQTYKNLEIILIDDGSTDKSGKICDEYAKKDSRVKVLHKENRGQATARNLGLEYATGDYLGFVDSDDWISTDMYEHLIQLLNNNNADIAFIERCMVNGKKDEYKKSIKKIKEKIYKDQEIIEEYLKYGMKSGNYGLPNYVYEKKLFSEIKFPDGKICEDIVTNYRLMEKATRLVKSNKVCYYYFQDNSSTTRNKFSKKDFDLIYACDELMNKTKNKNCKIRKLVKEKRDRCDFSLLAKIAYYGIDNEEKYQEEIGKMIKNIRKNYFELIKTNMKFIRKIQLTFFVINYNFMRKTYKLIHKLLKGEI